ncbi:DUF5668 domain-containing protein [Pseudoduganella sp. LjRoot289]|uniref:LiaF transmembrane domain-containing protein n=1 Tax=Pseudoduganella sp. LjRoot289 TaxID=3342314 RepID=UPI003ECFC568
MDNESGQSWRKQLSWGIILTGAGAVFLLDRSGVLDLGSIWSYWPWMLAVAGISNLVPPSTAKLVQEGCWQLFFAAWFYCSYEHVWGLGFGNSWPLVLIMWGLTVVLRPALHRYFESNQERDYGK